MHENRSYGRFLHNRPPMVGRCRAYFSHNVVPCVLRSSITPYKTIIRGDDSLYRHEANSLCIVSEPRHWNGILQQMSTLKDVCTKK